ncbi:MAG: hypothetical protein JSW09_06935, partial [Pseudomonadota bacterium]
MPRKVVSILVGAMIAATAIIAWAQTAPRRPPVHVAIVTDGSSERVDALRASFLEELRAVNRGEFDIQAPANLQVDADRTLTGVRAALERVLADPQTDVIVTLGVLASHAAAQRANLPKPVVAPLVANPKLQGLPYK